MTHLVVGELCKRIEGLDVKPKYNELSLLYSKHHHPDMRDITQSVIMWLNGLSPLFEEDIIIKFMRDDELFDEQWWKFYFDGVRLHLYVDINVGRTKILKDINGSLPEAIAAIREWYTNYLTILKAKVKYNRSVQHWTKHGMDACCIMRYIEPAGHQKPNLIKFAENNIRARVAVVKSFCYADDDDVLRPCSGEVWYYSAGTFIILEDDFTMATLKKIRDDVNHSIETTQYWIERLLS